MTAITNAAAAQRAQHVIVFGKGDSVVLQPSPPPPQVIERVQKKA